MLNQFDVFDSHLHIIDKRFPITPNNGYTPEAFTCEDYQNRLSAYKLCGGAIVSGSFQAFDQRYLLEALHQLGTTYIGVTQLPATVTNDQIAHLNNQGIRAIRFNLKRGGSEKVANLHSMAKRVYEVAGWHTELYVDTKELPDLYETLIALPAVSIDHLGLSRSGQKLLLKLVEKGVRVKATGFSRVDFDVKDALKALYSANPKSLLFGTDLPSTRAPRPYSDNDLRLVIDTLGPEAAKNILSKNALEFYRLSSPPRHIASKNPGA